MQIAQKSVSKSIQNECAADTAGGVQRGLGMLPQQAICENFSSGGIFVNKWTCTGLHCLPICEGSKYGSKLFPAWELFIYTACGQFIHKPKFYFGILNLCPTWVQVKLRVLTIWPVPKSGTSQKAGTVPLSNLARSNLVPVWHEVRTNNWQI